MAHPNTLMDERVSQLLESWVHQDPSARERLNHRREGSGRSPFFAWRVDAAIPRTTEGWLSSQLGDWLSRFVSGQGSPTMTKLAQNMGCSGIVKAPAGVETVTRPARRARRNDSCAVRKASAAAPVFRHSR